jgi:hypothetical protein
MCTVPLNRRWVTNDKNAFAPDARNNEDLGVELFSVSPKFKTPAMPLITENWRLDLKPGAVSPCLYDWKNYQYCAQIKTVIRSSATDKVLHPKLSFAVNANCSNSGELFSPNDKIWCYRGMVVADPSGMLSWILLVHDTRSCASCCNRRSRA